MLWNVYCYMILIKIFLSPGGVTLLVPTISSPFSATLFSLPFSLCPVCFPSSFRPNVLSKLTLCCRSLEISWTRWPSLSCRETKQKRWWSSTTRRAGRLRLHLKNATITGRRVTAAKAAASSVMTTVEVHEEAIRSVAAPEEDTDQVLALFQPIFDQILF